MKRRVCLLLVALVLCAGASACGNKGPLYLPEKKQVPATPGEPPVSQTE